MSLGNLSYLDKKLEPSGPHSFRDPESGVSVAYGRDRGEKNQGARISKDVEDFMDLSYNDSVPYMYLWDPKSKSWKFSKTGNKINWLPL